MSQRARSQLVQYTPAGVIAIAACAAFLIIYPLLSLASGVQWSSIGSLASQASNLTALRISLVTSLVACLAATATGLGLALVLARARGVWAVVLRALVLAPLVMPPVVSGLSLLMAYGRHGLLAPLFELLNIHVVFSPAAVVLAQIFVSLPFVVVTLEGTFRSRGLDQERTASALGAGKFRILRTITIPRFMPMIIVAATLAFARAMGEFGATLTFAGSLEGSTRTLPLQIYLLRETELAQAVGMSAVLVIFSLVIVALAYARGPLGTRSDA